MDEQPSVLADVDRDFFAGRRWRAREIVALGFRIGTPFKVYGTKLVLAILAVSSFLTSLLVSEGAFLEGAAAFMIAGVAPLVSAPLITTSMLFTLYRNTKR